MFRLLREIRHYSQLIVSRNITVCVVFCFVADGDSDDTDDDNNNMEYTLPSVVAVVAVIAFIATGLAVAVWRRRRKQR